MAKLWAWSMGTAALIGLTIVGAATCGANANLAEDAHLAEIAPNAGSGPRLDPACTPGPNYSAAACLAATAPDDGPIATAGGDRSPVNMPPEKLARLEMAQPVSPTKPSSQDAAPAAPAISTLNQTRAVASRAGATNAAPAVPAAVRMAFAGGTDAPRQARLRAALDLPRLSADVERFRRSVQLRIPVDGLARLVGVAQNFGDRARVYIFAGRGNRVLGFNMSHESGGFGGFGPAGWSMERAEKVADAQVGVAWKRGQFSVAVLDVQRKFAQFGAEVKDNLVGLHFTFTPGAKDHRAPAG